MGRRLELFPIWISWVSFVICGLGIFNVPVTVKLFRSKDHMGWEG